MQIINKCSELENELNSRFGPLIGGQELRSTLGYKAPSTFSRAIKLNLVGVHVFAIPSRRGRFALTSDVAKWLIHVSQSTEVINNNRAD